MSDFFAEGWTTPHVDGGLPGAAAVFGQGLRYEVALDVLGGVLAHCAERIALGEATAVDADGAVVPLEQVQADIRRVRDHLDPDDPAAVEAVIGHYAPLVRRLFVPSALRTTLGS